MRHWFGGIDKEKLNVRNNKTENTKGQGLGEKASVLSS